MSVDVSKLQQTMIILVFAAVIVAGVQCSNHEAEGRSAHSSHEDVPMRIKAQSRISMPAKGGYGARVQIREDLHGRKHAHAMAICDCNAQGPWRPLFKPSQILKTEFPEHESFHEDVDSHYRSVLSDQLQDNHLRSSPSSSDHSTAGSDSGGGGSFSGGVSGGTGGFGGGTGGFGGGTGTGLTTKKHNHMIHLHLIPHIYVPVMHSAGLSEAKNYHATVDDVSSSPVQIHHHQPGDSSPEFPSAAAAGDAASGAGQAAGNNHADNPSPAADLHDHGNFNGHSGETSYFTITEDAVHHNNNQDLHDHFGNSIDGVHHDYEVPSNGLSDEPHQYQVHEHDDLSNDYSNKKHVMSVSTTVSKPQLQQQQQQQQLQLQQQQQLQQQLHKYRKAVAKSNRAKHGRKLTSRQDLKNLLVMRPPPMGQSQTWRYVYNHPATMARHHQYYQRKPPMAAAAAAAPPLMPAVLKTRTVPLILHIRQRSDN